MTKRLNLLAQKVQKVKVGDKVALVKGTMSRITLVVRAVKSISTEPDGQTITFTMENDSTIQMGRDETLAIALPIK